MNLANIVQKKLKMSYILILSCIVLIISACSTNDISGKRECPEIKTLGSYNFNTKKDEMMPLIFENRLYYSSESKNKNKNIIYSISLDSLDLQLAQKEDLPLSDFTNYSTPSFYRNKANNSLEMYFSGEIKKGKKNKDIYMAIASNGKWSKPINLDIINTLDFESQPFVSSDGNTLVFVSDREGGIGSTDLYYSKRTSANNWSKPELISNVNTKYSEQYPSFDNDGNLLFISKGLGDSTNFDVAKALKYGNNWKEAKAMLIPFNSSSDEIGICANKEKIVVASTRVPNCGGSDLYIFDKCGAVVLECKVSPEKRKFPTDGKIFLMDMKSNIIDQKNYIQNESTTFLLNANQKYKIKYQNDCSKDLVAENEIYAPCSDTSVIKITSQILIPSESKEFNFEKYNVPFFVSGYYIPNTSNNLKDLRLKFKYNLIGAADSTKYINYPDEEYDVYAKVVDEALENALEYITNKIDQMEESCTKGNEILRIKVTGYADPRKFSEKAIYTGYEVNDTKNGIKIKNGEKLDNEKISKLRAYYTAKTIEDMIKKQIGFEKYESIQDKIDWNLQGKGIDKSENEDSKKRRVSFKISLEYK
jgi:hypothetical protein